LPIYEYKCEGCGETFELIQKFSDEPLTVHEKCGGAVHRLLSAPALQFKGTGWYVTDYAKSNSGAASKGESKSDSGDKPAADGAAKSESKTETKTETKTATSEKAN
jgi:putative FmdB family regulatory protein